MEVLVLLFNKKKNLTQIQENGFQSLENNRTFHRLTLPLSVVPNHSLVALFLEINKQTLPTPPLNFWFKL